MDWLKFALDRLFGFLAVLIPGSAVLLLFILHRPDLIADLWRAAYLSYETKVAISLLFTFAMGWTVSSGLASVLGALGGGLRGLLKANEPETRPWQNENWRALLTNYLGQVAPENVGPVSNELFEAELELIKLRPEEERAQLAVDAAKKKIHAELNDFQWRTWWDHFHQMSFMKLEPVDAMASTLTINFQAAGLVLLGALPFTPPLRTWWLITTCLFWTLLLIVQIATIIMKARDPWSSFTNQMERLQSGLGEKRIASKNNKAE